MPYPSRKIRRIRDCTHQRPQRNKDQYAVYLQRSWQFSPGQLTISSRIDIHHICPGMEPLLWHLASLEAMHLDDLGGNAGVLGLIWRRIRSILQPSTPDLLKKMSSSGWGGRTVTFIADRVRITKDGFQNFDSDDDSDDGEVLNKLEEYGNAGKLCRKKVINSFDGDDFAFQYFGFRKFFAYFDPFLPMNIITQKAYNTIMVDGLESTRVNLVSIARDVYVIVGSFTYVTDFVVIFYEKKPRSSWEFQGTTLG
ncbi:hypothetical protein Tco_0186158 [Tanacetum coccineum]